MKRTQCKSWTLLLLLALICGLADVGHSYHMQADRKAGEMLTFLPPLLEEALAKVLPPLLQEALHGQLHYKEEKQYQEDQEDQEKVDSAWLGFAKHGRKGYQPSVVCRIMNQHFCVTMSIDTNVIFF